ncbi:hypothetical protein, partial [Stenotrophomonas sepilia]|uniref:hypothetical protein n=1 Tax=Stenotrophomonas sepilia TaxID=2860290 RepID=UPI00320B4F91
AQGGLEGQDQQQEHPRMAWIYWVQLWPLNWVRLERAEHRRGIRGEEVPMSERSEFGTVP